MKVDSSSWRWEEKFSPNELLWQIPLNRNQYELFIEKKEKFIVKLEQIIYWITIKLISKDK